MKKNKTETLVFRIFLIIGLILLVIGTIICIKTFDYSDKIETTGIISEMIPYTDSDGDRSYTVYVEYKVDGENHYSKLNGYSSAYYVGMPLKIYYDKDNVTKIGTKGLDLVFLVFPGLGFIFACIGGVYFIISGSKKNKAKKLKETGTRIDATYVETTVNGSYTVNGESPYIIICEWNNPADGKKYRFKSQNLWVDPESTIVEKNITTIPVYIDMNNLKNYYVDVDDILNNIIDLT